jgi:hypothetical protein
MESRSPYQKARKRTTMTSKQEKLVEEMSNREIDHHVID